MYDPNAQAKEASIQKAQIMGAKEKVFTGALSVVFQFVFPRPKNHFRTGKNAGILKDDAPAFCCNQKDLDNMEKFYADSFNNIAYLDDRQIVETKASKRWAKGMEIPHVVMTIQALEGK
jgi:Holliday junction resolvase RusA-like endonuclease